MATFGTGNTNDQNDFCGSGSNTFWTNWNTSQFSSGNHGRITTLGVRWGVNTSFCSSTTGHNSLWFSGTSLATKTGDFGVSATQGAGSFYSAACTDLWQTSQNYYIGFSRASGGCESIIWKDGAHGNYAGKSAGDANNGSGSTNWCGFASPGGIQVQGTVNPTPTYVKRGGVYTQAFVYVQRGGVWSATPSYVYKNISGTWTLLNFFEWIQKTERHIPEKGFKVWIDNGDGLEPGWILEEGDPGWFGNVSFEQSKIWEKEGPTEKLSSLPFDGRYNSWEPEEVVESRLRAHYEWDQALRWENYQAANEWYKLWQPESLELVRSSKLTTLPKIEAPVLDEPEPILIPCGCG